MTPQADRVDAPAPAPGVLDPPRYAVLDVETTGLSPRRDRVVQVAVTLLDAQGAEEGSWSTLVDPERDPGPVHVHGITSERLQGAPRFADVAGHLAALLAGRVFVAHNAAFDWGFVTAEMARAGCVLDVERRLCTRRLARRLDLPVADLKLSTLAAHWGVEQLQAHDAADDTRVLVEVLHHCLRIADDLGVDLPFTTGDGSREVRPVVLPGEVLRTLHRVLDAPVQAPPSGPWTGRRVLVLGGPPDAAAAARTAVRGQGGAVGVVLTATTTDVVVLPGAREDPGVARALRAGLGVLDVPGQPGRSAVLTTPLPPRPRRWLLDVRWGSAGDPVEVDVVPTRAGVPVDLVDGVRRDAGTAGEVEVTVALDRLAEGVDGVLLVVGLPPGTSFPRVGPVELTLRRPDGAPVAGVTLDGAAGAAHLVLGGLVATGESWSFRSGG